ncbi:MAG: type III pantothenate kinase [Actinobacteria bacterium]|nr:type III pantothenate kinase [Actinomycetota bacterium]
MLLAIDVGNTQTVLGLFTGRNEPEQSWRMVTPKHETSDEIASSIYSFLKNSDFDPAEITQIAVSCVVPRIIHEINKMCDKYFKIAPFIISTEIKTDLKIEYDFPKEIGADRIANSVAAKEIYGCPAIVLDFGTATTFDVISSEGSYIGGVICPGIEISSDALFNYAAKLSKVDLSWPDNVIGKNTYDGIRSGILYGFLGQAEYITCKIIKEMQNKEKVIEPNIIATGGLAILMNGRSKYIQFYDSDLTLKGLKILIDKNSK